MLPCSDRGQQRRCALLVIGSIVDFRFVMQHIAAVEVRQTRRGRGRDDSRKPIIQLSSLSARGVKSDDCIPGQSPVDSGIFGDESVAFAAGLREAALGCCQRSR